MGIDDHDALRAENEALRARVTELERLYDEEAAGFLRSILALVPAFIIRIDPDLRIRYINQLQPGLTMDEVLGRNSLDYVAPSSRQILQECIERAARTGEPQHFEVVGDGPHGEPAHYDSYVAPVTEADGRRGFCVAAFDVSQHKRREAAWRESEEKLRLALDATGIGLWSWDAVTHEVEWDARMRELCGVAEPLDLRRYTRELVHPEDRALVEEGGRATLSTGEYVGVPHRLLRSDGSVRWIVTSASMLRDDQGKPIRLVGGNLDITEQRMLEEQLRQAQKMEALGNLTAGIAHNLNNVLMVLLPSLELLERAVPPEHAQTARDARQSAQRGAEYIRELMTFAGQRGAVARRAHDVGEIVVRALRMCRRTFDQEIDLDARVASGTPLILCDAAGVEQVLWNVLLNARDALAALEPRGVDGERPRIHVTVDSVGAVTLPAQVSRRAPRYVRIRVEDNGPGMSAEVRRKIFEPFFTTKSVTQASGLGLATSYAIIRDHDGWIACESRQGVGTVISVHLPVTTEEPAVVTEPASAASTPGATILLVDDEEAIRHVVAQLLEEEGHRVIAVPGGADALAAARKHREVALVMLDRSMAGMAGHKLVQSLREQLPAARIVYFTGQDVPAKERALVDGVICKPLSGLALSLAVREALTAMPGRSPD